MQGRKGTQAQISHRHAARLFLIIDDQVLKQGNAPGKIDIPLGKTIQIVQHRPGNMVNAVDVHGVQFHFLLRDKAKILARHVQIGVNTCAAVVGRVSLFIV